VTAICGSVRRGTAPLDLTHFVQHYAERDRAHFFPDGPAGAILTAQPCPVRADVCALEVMLDGIADHGRTAMSGGIPEWTMSAESDVVTLSLTYKGLASAPTGWSEGGIPPHTHHQIPDLFFAREAARTLGGDIAFSEDGDRTSITLTLPLVKT